jgi:putative peptidoglycan lipid II flippase
MIGEMRTDGAMTATAAPTRDDRRETGQPALGGYAALAEAAWMGAPQAADILEPLRVAAPRAKAGARRLALAGLWAREFSIPEASVLPMVSFFLSAALGAVRQVLFNAEFGAGVEANAYYAAFRLPGVLFSLIAGGALSSAMIPVLLSATREEGALAGRRLTNLVLTTLLAVLAGVVVVSEILAPFFVTMLLAPGFDPATSELTVTLTRIMLLQPLILAVGSVATAILNSRNQFLPPALSVVSHNLTLILGILATRAYPELGIYGPTLGVIGGALLQAAILLPGLRERGTGFRPAWDPGTGGCANSPRSWSLMACRSA